MNDAERFATLKKEDLKAIAGYFSESDEGTKKDIAERLVDGGVSWSDWQRVSRQDPLAPKVEGWDEAEEAEKVAAPVQSMPSIDLRQGAPAPDNPQEKAPQGVVTTKDMKVAPLDTSGPTPESVAAEAEFVKEAPAPQYHEGTLVEKPADQTVQFYHPGGPITLDAGEYVITRKGAAPGANLLAGLMQSAAPPPVRAKVPTDSMLIKMDRQNPKFTVENITFHASSPFAVVDRETAKRILVYPGFREASPSEAEAFFS